MTEESLAPLAPFDLGSVKVADVVDLPIKHPTSGDPTSWVLQIAGPGHAVTLALQNETARERMTIERDQEQARVNGRKWKGPDVDPETERQKTLRRVARRIVGWSPVTMNGQAFPYSADAAAALMLEPRHIWVREQVLAMFGEDAAFIVRSARA